MIVGRQEEVARLVAVLRDARASRACRVALVGDAGIGKTALLDAARVAGGDMATVMARGVESEAEVPFGGLFDLLRPIASLIAGLPGPLAGALDRAFGLEAGAGGDRFAVGAATLGVLAAAAERSPLLVLVDDLQWIDRPSREAILFAARRLEADAVAVIVAVRDDGTPDEGELAGFDVVRIGGLALDAVAAIVGEARAVAALALTGGNPLALEHIRADLDFELTPTPVPLPRRLSERYERVLEPLSMRCRQALLVAAAEDAGAASVIARALAGTELSLADLSPAEGARLLRIASGRIAFTHPLVRSAIYHTASPAERRSAHAALADAYAADGDDTREAWHRAATAVGPDDLVAAALERLGDDASSRAAYATAARAYERAADVSPQRGNAARRLLAATGAAWSAGRAADAEAFAARARIAAGGDAQVRADAAMLWGRVATTAGRSPRDIVELLDSDATALAESRPDLASLMLAQASDRAYFGHGDVELAERLADRAAAIAGTLPTQHPRVLQIRAWHQIRRGDLERGVPLMRRAGEEIVAAGAGHPASLLDAAYVAIWSGDLPSALALAERAEESARARGDVGLLPEILGTLGEMRSRCDGDWSAGLAVIADGAELARETGQALTAAYVATSLAEFCAYRGEAERARDALSHAAGFRPIRVWCDIGATFVEALLAIDAGDLEAALAPFPPTARAFDVWWGMSTERIEALARLGRLEEARSAIADAEPVMTMPFSRARLDRCRGLVAAGDDYVGPLRRSIDAFALQHTDFERARSELALGERLRRAGQRIAAREHLRVALDVFERTGARPWAERARRELAASGERRRRRDGAADELTPQERYIAQLVAEGRTNREVAATVFLSPKTVEAHLGRVFRKLGISSRADLAAALAPRDSP